MSKNRELKRRRKLQKGRNARRGVLKLPRAQQSSASAASAQTMWRTMHLDFTVQEQLVATTLQVQPLIRQRDAEDIKRVEEASDVEAVLDLAPMAVPMPSPGGSPGAGSAISRGRKRAYRSAASGHCVGVTMRLPMR